MKAYIISRNRLTLTVNTANWLCKYVEPIIIDNNSTYRPLLEWYKKCPYEVVMVDDNLGSRVVWHRGILDRYSPNENYIVTDPDLDFTGIPDDWIDEMQYGLDHFSYAAKVGIGLRMDDLPNTEIARRAKEWEAQHWAYPLENGRFYKASTSTTLCLCRTRVHEFPSVRTNEPYLARHIPWYYTSLDELPEDEIYYMKTIDKKRWNYWSVRIADMLGVHA